MVSRKRYYAVVGVCFILLLFFGCTTTTTNKTQKPATAPSRNVSHHKEVSVNKSVSPVNKSKTNVSSSTQHAQQQSTEQNNEPKNNTKPSVVNTSVLNKKNTPLFSIMNETNHQPVLCVAHSNYVEKTEIRKEDNSSTVATQTYHVYANVSFLFEPSTHKTYTIDNYTVVQTFRFYGASNTLLSERRFSTAHHTVLLYDFTTRDHPVLHLPAEMAEWILITGSTGFVPFAFTFNHSFISNYTLLCANKQTLTPECRNLIAEETGLATKVYGWAGMYVKGEVMNSIKPLSSCTNYALNIGRGVMVLDNDRSGANISVHAFELNTTFNDVRVAQMKEEYPKCSNLTVEQTFGMLMADGNWLIGAVNNQVFDPTVPSTYDFDDYHYHYASNSTMNYINSPIQSTTAIYGTITCHPISSSDGRVKQMKQQVKKAMGRDGAVKQCGESAFWADMLCS